MNVYLVELLIVTQENKVVPATLDLNPVLINSIVGTNDGTTYISFKTGDRYLLQHPYEEFTKFIKSFVEVQEPFDEDVKHVNKKWNGETN